MVDDLKIKSDRVFSRQVSILCRRNCSYQPEMMNVPYVLREDDSLFFLAPSGCGKMDGSKECEICRNAIPVFLLNHPDTNIRKPFLPIFDTEEKH